MFTQRLSMDCTQEQYEKYLKDELLKMGYKEYSVNCWEHTNFHYICNNYSGWVRDLGTIRKDSIDDYSRTYLGSFNAPLFLALAAMTDKAEGNYGEYWVCIKDNAWFTENNLYKSIGVYHDKSPMFYDNKCAENGAFINHLFKYFRKATKEELMEKFGENGSNTYNVEDYKDRIDSVVFNLGKLATQRFADKLIKDSKEQLDAINLLKSKGYKILKPKTWEEV